MSKVRLLIAGITTALLTAGYLASQVAYANGTSAEYAAKVDQQPIVLLSLVLFLAAIALHFIPQSQEPED